MSRTEEKSCIKKPRRRRIMDAVWRCRFVASRLEIGYLDYPLASPSISQDAAELGQRQSIRKGCNEAALLKQRQQQDGGRGSFMIALAPKERVTPTEHSPAILSTVFLSCSLLHSPSLSYSPLLLYFLYWHTRYNKERLYLVGHAQYCLLAYHRSDRRLTIGSKQEDENGNGNKERIYRLAEGTTETTGKIERAGHVVGLRKSSRSDFQLKLDMPTGGILRGLRKMKDEPTAKYPDIIK